LCLDGFNSLTLQTFDRLTRGASRAAKLPPGGDAGNMARQSALIQINAEHRSATLGVLVDRHFSSNLIGTMM
jgi:hypothetical protein